MDHVADQPVSVNRLAARATTHCLIGCGIGEVLGVVIGTALGWSTAATIALAIALAFVFGYSLTIWPLLASGMALRRGARAGPGGRYGLDHGHGDRRQRDPAAHPRAPWTRRSTSWLFWGSLAVALAIAWVVTFPVNRWLIARGRGHAVVHGSH